MKAVILYHPNSEHARIVEEYVHNFSLGNSHKIDLMSLETREGAAEATLYDIVSYPALMIIDESGRLQKVWQGSTMPLMNEVAGYLVA
jgi:hypothetical protein